MTRIRSHHEVKFRYWHRGTRRVAHDVDCKFTLIGVCTCGLLHHLRTLRDPKSIYPDFEVDDTLEKRSEDILLEKYPELQHRMESLEK